MVVTDWAARSMPRLRADLKQTAKRPAHPSQRLRQAGRGSRSMGVLLESADTLGFTVLTTCKAVSYTRDIEGDGPPRERQK